MTQATVLAILAAVAVLWLALRSRGKAARSQLRRKSAFVAEPGRSFHWPSLGNFDFEVVGESHHQSAISRLAGNHSAHGAATQCIAELVPDDGNPYDPKAVAVQIQGHLVGYLSREDARSFRRRLGQKGLSGVATTCDATIAGGGTRKSGEKLFYGVRLDIKPFE